MLVLRKISFEIFILMSHGAPEVEIKGRKGQEAPGGYPISNSKFLSVKRTTAQTAPDGCLESPTYIDFK